MAKRFK